MRVDLPGVTRTTGFRLRFDGREIDGFPGESVAAVLVNAGVMTMRRTARGDSRGLHCGMGICGDCTVAVDGVARQACMTAAAADMIVTTAPALAVASDTAGTAPPPTLRATCDVLVVGAGPAGLAAARMAAACGVSVFCIDERGKAGGQYYKQPGPGFAVDATAIDRQFADGAALAAAAAAAGVTILYGATAWSATQEEAGFVVSVAGAGAPQILTAQRVIIATGAFERPWPVPGWTLPGVMSTGGAQTLLRAGLTAPGKRVLIAGNGPLNIQLAHELARAGVEVVALVEQAPAIGPRGAMQALAMLASAPGLIRNGLMQTVALRRGGVPRFAKHVLVRVEGKARAEHAVIAAVADDGGLVFGSERRFAVDAVSVGAGFLPQAELARALGCRFDWHDDGPHAVRGDDGRSSVARVFIVGDGGGMGGARVALAQGELAGASAARDLIGKVPRDAERLVQRATAALARARRFQKALWQLFAPQPITTMLATPDTLLCRCESVDHGTVAALIAAGALDVGSIKRASRVGMGRCQGRYCSPLLLAMIARATGRPPEADDGFAPRPPFKPLPIAALAAR